MIDTDLSLRRLALTILAAFLIVNAGCLAGIGGDSPGSDAAEAKTEAEAEEKLTPEDGDDLRTLSFDEDFEEVEGQGELDGDDPRQNNKVYEPVEFVGKEGQFYNITMESYFGTEEMRLIDPDGEVVAVATGNSGDDPAELDIQLNKTGKYTIEATSVEEMETFTYTLTVNEVKYAGPPDEWNENERFNQFVDFAEHYWEEQHAVSNATADFESTNTSDDFVVVEYERAVDDNESVQSTHIAVMARTIIEIRNFYTEDLERENPNEWYPDRIYFKGYSEDGDLVETNYVSQRWTAEYMTGGNKETNEYYYRIVKTTKVGPAHNLYYTIDDNETVEEDQFPYPTYPEEYVDTLDKE